MTAYEDYRKNFTKMIDSGERTEMDVFETWIQWSFFKQLPAAVKEEKIKQDGIAAVQRFIEILGNDEFVDSFRKPQQAEHAKETGFIDSIALSELNYRVSMIK